jgi:hypothetical protein
VNSSHARRVWLFDSKQHIDTLGPTKGRENYTFEVGLQNQTVANENVVHFKTELVAKGFT